MDQKFFSEEIHQLKSIRIGRWVLRIDHRRRLLREGPFQARHDPAFSLRSFPRLLSGAAGTDHNVGARTRMPVQEARRGAVNCESHFVRDGGAFRVTKQSEGSSGQSWFRPPDSRAAFSAAYLPEVLCWPTSSVAVKNLRCLWASITAEKAARVASSQ